MAILTSPSLALLFVGLIPIVAVALVIIINKTFPMFGEVQHRLDGLNTVMQENLAGVRVVKAFARAKHEFGRFVRANDRLMNQNILATRTSAITMPFMMLALNGGVVAAIWIGGPRVTGGSLEVGQLIAFINYLMQALMNLMMVSMLVVRVSRAEASAVRVNEVLASTPTVLDRPDARTTFTPRGRIEFEDVTFSYDGRGGDPVLKNVSFVAEAGRNRGDPGRDRIGQIEPGQPGAALLRRQRWTCDDRRRRCARHRTNDAAWCDRARLAGIGAVQRHDPRQHPLRTPRSDRRRSGGSRQNGTGRRLYPRLPRWLRHDRGTARCQPVGRAESSASPSRGRC